MLETSKLRIAIIGGGIAGLAAAVALQNHEGVDVQLYEQAREIREVGASIALGPNGMRVLEKLGVSEALGRDIAFPNSSGSPMIYRHWATNEVVSVDEHHGDVEERHHTSRFYRPHLQHALLSHVERSRVHLNKTFLAVEIGSKTDPLTVSFTDGSSIQADILLGADGIKSAVRRHFIPTSDPQWTGWVAFRSVFDVKLMEHIPGVLDEASHWWGPDRTFFASRLGKNLFTIVGGNQSDPNAPDAPYKDSVWNTDESVESVREMYADWHPVVKQLLDVTPNVRHYPNTFAQGLESWVHGDGRVTFAGDAAHAHGGAFAAGGSLALDDAFAFSLAILQVYPVGLQKLGTDDITRALKLYEGTRKMHTDRVLTMVHAKNEKAIERVGMVETDEQLRKRMLGRDDLYWIHEHDVEVAFAAALVRETSYPPSR